MSFKKQQFFIVNLTYQLEGNFKNLIYMSLKIWLSFISEKFLRTIFLRDLSIIDLYPAYRWLEDIHRQFRHPLQLELYDTAYIL